MKTYIRNLICASIAILIIAAGLAVTVKVDKALGISILALSLIPLWFPAADEYSKQI